MDVKTEQFAADDNDDFMDSDFGLTNDLDDCSETGEFQFIFSGMFHVCENQFKAARFTIYRES